MAGTQRVERSEELSLPEIDERYRGRWVAVSVTAMDEWHVPLAGHVVAAGTHVGVYQVLAQLVTPGNRPTMPYAVFAAGALLPDRDVEDARPEPERRRRSRST